MTKETKSGLDDVWIEICHFNWRGQGFHILQKQMPTYSARQFVINLSFNEWKQMKDNKILTAAYTI